MEIPGHFSVEINSAAALTYAHANPQRRARLPVLAARLRQGLRDSGLAIGESPAPIVAFRTGKRAEMIVLQRQLFDDGIFVLLSNYLGAGPDRAGSYAASGCHNLVKPVHYRTYAVDASIGAQKRSSPTGRGQNTIDKFPWMCRLGIGVNDRTEIAILDTPAAFLGKAMALD